MILMIDHYDSFSDNIARHVRLLGVDVVLHRHDSLSLEMIADLAPEKIILSPGPKAPADAGLAMALLTEHPARWPILGICLGHQCIGAAFGGIITRAQNPMHGRASDIHHDGKGVFAGLPNPLRVGRYHSLIVTETPALDEKMDICARSAEGEIMALRHKSLPISSIQFHPESILTDYGLEMLRQFVSN